VVFTNAVFIFLQVNKRYGD